jgi:hypothetical protein
MFSNGTQWTELATERMTQRRDEATRFRLARRARWAEQLPEVIRLPVVRSGRPARRNGRASAA